MQIDLQKLARLEEVSHQHHVVVMDINTRRNEARREWQFQRAFFLDQLRRNDFNLAQKLEERWDVSALAGHRFEREYAGRMKGIDKLKTEADRLRTEHDATTQRWQGAHACLPALRDFARQYGVAGKPAPVVLESRA